MTAADSRDGSRAAVVAAAPPEARCPNCAIVLAPAILACPSCDALVHRDELRLLSESARDASRRGDTQAALSAWRRVLALLPPESLQATRVVDRIRALREGTGAASVNPSAMASAATPTLPGGDAAAAGAAKSKRSWAAVLSSGVALALVKLKWIWTVIKPLLLGFTKLGTLASMLVSLGAYWAAYGWKFGLGLVLSIYVHEIGHVVALQRLGITASAPMFIPGVGAFVRLNQYPVDVIEDARVGLAGPVWGLGAAIFAFVLGTALGSPSLLAISRVGGWINLFNLVPIPPLDGGRGFRALTTAERRAVAVILGVAWWLVREPLVALLAAIALLRGFEKQAARPPASRMIVRYLLVALSLALVARFGGPEGP